MRKPAVLLIENQITQFDKIKIKLCDYFEIYPKNNESFNEIADLVKISLTIRYDEAKKDPGIRRENALKKLVEKINEMPIEVIIIDYILVGHHSGENGIHLAKKFKNNNIVQPIIFLSKNDIYHDKVQFQLSENDFKDPIWVEKGYASQGLENEHYFKKNVRKKINNLIDTSVKDNLEWLLKVNAFEEYYDEIRDVFEHINDIDYNQRQTLKEFVNNKTTDVNKLLELINSLS